LISKLFGSSGVRGLVNVTLTPELVAKIGLALVTSTNAQKILVGRDTRSSGLMLEQALVSSLLAGGATVECLGIVPTPVLAYLTKIIGADVGVMITASHNPAPYNGLKVFDHTGTAFTAQHQQEIEATVKIGQFKLTSWKTIPHAKSVSSSHYYLDAILSQIQLNRRWNILVDPGCGATCYLAPKLLRRLGCTITTINGQSDGNFPSRSPEPNLSSLTTLAQSVEALDADIGIAYDGDGDRVAFIDDTGTFVDPDQILAAYAVHVISNQSDPIIVTNVETSMSLEYSVERQGGKVIRTKVGDIYLSEKIKQHSAIFGGEPCGAWIHPHFNLCPDGLLSSILLLKALDNTKQDLVDFISSIPKYPILRKSIQCQNTLKHVVLKKIQGKIKSVFPFCENVETIDGVRCTFNKSWMLIRASGTEPLLRITVEALTLREAQNLMKKGIALINTLKEGAKQ